jgi:hypothetical protein
MQNPYKRLNAQPMKPLGELMDSKISLINRVHLQDILLDYRNNVAAEALTAYIFRMVKAHPSMTLKRLLEESTRIPPSPVMQTRKRKRLTDKEAEEIIMINEQESFVKKFEGSLPEGPYECGVCLSSHRKQHVVQCHSNHPMCYKCLFDYIVKTHNICAIDSVKCPVCPSLYSYQQLEGALPRLVVKKMLQRAQEINERVGLNAGDVVARIECRKCGHAGVVLRADATKDGTIRCVCGYKYCTKCGNVSHPGSACPPPQDTIRWLEAYAKKCPNCGMALEKNDGCNHFTCSKQVGGCGHEFCWLCLKPWGTHVECRRSIIR